MKLVASSKLHKAEADIEAVRPYERTLEEILSVVESYRSDEEGYIKASDAPVAVVAFSSNSSLCGAFNSNVIHKVLDTCAECASVKVIPVGRKMAEAVRKTGLGLENDDHGDIIGKPDYYKSRTLARELRKRFADGEFSKVLLVYNKYVSSGFIERGLHLRTEPRGARRAAGALSSYHEIPCGGAGFGRCRACGAYHSDADGFGECRAPAG